VPLLPTSNQGSARVLVSGLREIKRRKKNNTKIQKETFTHIPLIFPYEANFLLLVIQLVFFEAF